MADKEKQEGRGFIRYVGTATRRGLTVENFRSVGVNNQDEEVWWDRSNNWTVSREALSDEAFEMAVRIDPEFILIGGDEEESRKPMAAEMTPMPDPPEPPKAPVVGTPFAESSPVEMEGDERDESQSGNSM